MTILITIMVLVRTFEAGKIKWSIETAYYVWYYTLVY